VSAADRRTVEELLAESDELARETLLDATPDHGPAMVRSWNQLVGSAAELWAVLPSAPDTPSGLDPMERLRAVGEAIGRNVSAGHWPGHRPTDERWGELTNPASRTDPALVAAASEVRAAIAAVATNPTGWATPDQLVSRLDLPDAVKPLHLSMVASIDIAYVVRDTAADHPGLTAPARIIGMRTQGEAEIAVEQGETRYEGVTWTTRHQIAANQLIPLPEPARED
jgi:hypothetical protein